MAFACRLPSGADVRLDDLPLGVWADVSKTAGLEAGDWAMAMIAPARWPAAAVAILEACAAHAGEEVPPVGYLTGATVFDVFHDVGDDRPHEYEEGVPDPKAADG